MGRVLAAAIGTVTKQKLSLEPLLEDDWELWLEQLPGSTMVTRAERHLSRGHRQQYESLQDRLQCRPRLH
jgi:hypothetical protein